jgi:fatty acid desaturase
MAITDVASFAHLSAEDVEALGREFDEIRRDIEEARGEKDAAHIRRMIYIQRRLVVAARLTLLASMFPPAWVAGTTMLAAGKILENMEIGHNVMHGQFDWMNDPEIHSSTWEWDTTCPAEQWKHSHNFLHHTFTNVIGKDNDVGYGILRVTSDQQWHPVNLGQPIYNALLALLFVTANTARNLWAYLIIFCGHFPDGAEKFAEEQLEHETKAEWYLRQLLGSANFEGNRLLHIMSGSLGYQIEHHLFPDLPCNRYSEMSVRVKALCEKYDLPYTTGPLHRQYGQVLRTLMKLSLPGKPTAP